MQQRTGSSRSTAKQTEEIHDRLAEVAPEQRQGIVLDIVEDPYKAGENIRVLRATRDDPLAGLLARGAIDPAQMQAGRTWQRHWEAAVVGAIRAIDPTKEPVDGKGPTPAMLTERRAEAMLELRQAALLLGWEGDRLVHEILGERRSLAEVAIRHGREKRYIGARFRECLETLARLWMLVGN